MDLYTGLQAVAFVLLCVFLTYVTLILVPFLRRRPDGTGDESAFSWHVFVPCRNEEVVIGRSLRRLRADFPQAHVWVIDDASTDATATIVAAAADVDARIHLVRRVLPEAQTGKGDALNAAYRQLVAWLDLCEPDVPADRVVVAVVDADGRLAPDALAVAAGPAGFADPVVGAAQCQVQMFELEAGYGRGQRLLRDLQDAEFRTTIAAMQVLRRRTVSVGLGGNGQFSRLSALHAIATQAGEPWHGALLEDYELGLHMALAGYENRYLHDAIVTQEAVVSLRALVRQRTRWCQGGIQCLRYLPELARSSRIGEAATLEMAYFLCTPIFQLVGMVLWPVILGLMVVGGVNASGGLLAFASAAWWLLPLTVLTGIAPFAVWGIIYGRERDAGPLRSLRYGVAYWLYSYLSHVFVVNAAQRLVRGRNGWVKTARLGDAPAPEPAVTPAPTPAASAARGAVPAGRPCVGHAPARRRAHTPVRVLERTHR